MVQADSNRITRRGAIALLPAIASALAAALASSTMLLAESLAEARIGFSSADGLSSKLSGIAASSGGRLGCAVLDTATGGRAGIRQSQRFPMCSTSKVLSTALALHRVDQGTERLDRRIVFSRQELVSYSPVTEQHVGPPGMTVAEVCRAALIYSDNTAANLLLASFGGPAALTAFLRSVGDPVTRLDRTEPTLNEARPGDPRDTTTPAAMLENLRRFVLGDVLSSASREMLANWMMENTTGGARLRAGMPGDWRIGDKTGSGAYGTTNDVAVVWPRGRAPVLVTAYLTECQLPADRRDAILADVGRAVADAIQTG